MIIHFIMMQEFHSAFEKGEMINHLASSDPDTPHVQNDVRQVHFKDKHLVIFVVLPN